MNRRDLLRNAAKVTGLTALRAGTAPIFGGMELLENVGANAQAEGGTSTPTRKAPRAPITLSNSDLTISFDDRDGLPYSFAYQGEHLWGEDEGIPPTAVLCRLTPREYQTVSAQLVSVSHTPDSRTFSYSANVSALPAGHFSLRYLLQRATLTVTLEAIHEEPGFELIEVALPQQVTVREEDGQAWMAEGREGGSFVTLANANSFRFPDDPYFGRISTVLPVGMVGRNNIGCVMEVTAFEDGTETEIKGDPGRRHATIGCVMTHRVHGGRCYNMNDGGPPVCGNSHTPNLLTGQTPRTQFDFFRSANPAHPWLTGAKIVRARMPPSPTEYLSDRFLFIVAGKRKIDAEPKTTFAQARVLISDIAALTDYAPQVALMSGFAYDGQDTGFPSEDKINSGLGTDAELLELIQFGKTINANVSLNTNWDDAYRSSPVFDEAFIARRPDGAIWKSRAWDGEDSYVTGMAKFMSGGWGSKRIAFDADHFKIRDAILIDAMSWFAVRDDWDSAHPASAYRNLVDGKYKVIEEFRQRGIAVTSEQLRYPFIGKIAETMDGPSVSGCPFGGQPVPMLSTIYRGSAIWGGESGGSLRPQRELFWNTRSALWFQHDTGRDRITDFYYLIALPFSKLHRLAVDEYESHGPTRRISMEKMSHVVIDADSKDYSAVWEGHEIASNDATFCPIDQDRIAFYATTRRELRYPIPLGWKQSDIIADLLDVSGRQAFTIHFDKSMIVVAVEPRRPVIVYANKHAIHRTYPVA